MIETLRIINKKKMKAAVNMYFYFIFFDKLKYKNNSFDTDIGERS